MSTEEMKNVFNQSRETYEGSFNADLLEQYKLYVLSAENVSARRVASSRYLLTLNTALVALYGFRSAALGHGLWALSIPIMGIAASILWLWIIKSHGSLNNVKFRIIHELETHLPVRPFDHEWKLVEQGGVTSYRPVTRIEKGIPAVFIGLHVLLAIVSVVGNACGTG